MQAHASYAGATVRTCLRSVPVRHGARYTSINSIAFSPRPACRASTLRIAVPFVRGAKTKTTTKLKDLPQGALKLETYSNGVDEAPRYPKVVQDHRNNMEKFKNCVVLTRVGSFYELYWEQAEELAPLLNIKLASKKTNAGPVPMAGFPFFQLDRFLKILVQDLQKYVALSEEFLNPVEEKSKSGGLMFDRKVTRVITPGTLIDETFIDTAQNNFLLSLYVDTNYFEGQSLKGDEFSIAHLLSSSSGRVGLAWMDLSTGDFYTQVTTARMLPSAIARIGAREIIADRRLQNLLAQELRMLVGVDHQLLTFFDAPPTAQPMSEWGEMLEAPIPSETASTFTNEEVAAGFNLLEYVRVQLQGVGTRLQPPRRRHLDESMGIDRSSLRGLEILETARDGLGKGSLLHAVRRTATKSGARLLRDRLISPSTSLSVIQERLDLVSYFLQDEEIRDVVVSLLKRSYDSQRLVQKFTLGRGDPDDLIYLSRAIDASREVLGALSDRRNHRTPDSDPNRRSVENLTRRLQMDGPTQLAAKIMAAIDEEALLQKHRIEDSQAAETAQLTQDVVLNQGLPEDVESIPRKVRFKSKGRPGFAVESIRGDLDIWIMRREASNSLRQLHERLDELHEEQSALVARLQERVGSSMLTLKWSPSLGYICHVKGAKISQEALEELGITRIVSSTKSTRSFYLPAWSQLGERIDKLKRHIRAEEQEIFEELRREVILNLVKIRRNATVMDELDVACSFATLAKEQNMVRPILNSGTSHRIIGGRHPTVKLGLEEQGRRFVSNDCFIGDEERIWLITGPNMGGKSTFLRQNALITILAQVGSFVPAEYAEIGIVDQIFSRIGAADDLFRDQSTFMVEMLETAAILKQATPRSFVIMDEVGRGTTPEDGTAVGYACLEHLHNVNQSRTLFATHFHALIDMTAGFEKLSAYCTDVKESSSGSFSFVHKLRKGVNRQSHALMVARLAGLPEAAISMAESVLRQMGKSTETDAADWSKPVSESKAAGSG